MRMKRSVWIWVGVVCLPLVVAAVMFPTFSKARAKGAAPGPGMPPAGMMMGSEGEPAAAAAMEQAAEAPAPGAMTSAAVAGAGPAGGSPGSPGMPTARAPEPKLDKNAYYSSTYVGGSGERDRIEKLISDGVVIGGKTVKLAAFTREYSQAFEIPTKQAINLQVNLEKTKVAPSGEEVHLQVGLQAIKKEAPRRPAVNLCLVIDRSGSMEDENKLSFAKTAAMNVIEGLRSTDVLSVVAYDDFAEVLLPATKLSDKQGARRAVQALAPGGSTNIYEGLQKGYAELKKHFSKDAVNQAILISDGLVTAGVGDPGEFRALVSKMSDADMQTTTVGMGLDFDEALMMEISQAGRGGYHFIRDATQTEEVFQKELGQLTRVVAKAVKLRIVLPQGVELVRVLGSAALSAEQAAETKRTEERIDDRVYDELGIARDREKADEPGIKMLIPHFYAGDSHVVMLKLRVPKGKAPREVAKVEVKYKDLVFRTNRELTKPATVNYTTDKAKSVASISRSVKKNVLGFRTGEALLAAAEQVQTGRAAAAVKTIDEQMVLLGVAAREWKDKDLDRDGELLGRYRQVLASAGQNALADSQLGSYLAKSMTYSGYELTR